MARYIDADALLAEAMADGAYGYVDAKQIAEAPAADVAPVRHGRWEMKPDPFGFFHDIPVCSECGCTTKMRDKAAFCPHCGAQMSIDEVSNGKDD